MTREAAFIGYQLWCHPLSRSSRSRSFGSVRSCGRSRGVRVVAPPRRYVDGTSVSTSRALFQSAQLSECERDGHKSQMLCLASGLSYGVIISFAFLWISARVHYIT